MKRITDIKVGYLCNNDCIHCVIAGNREALLKEKKCMDKSTEECKDEIVEAKEKGSTKIVLTGGEPTIRKDFWELIALSKEQSLDVLLQTNGRAFKDFEFAREVANLPIQLFGVALHGPSEEIHDQVTRRKGSFSETIKGIENLKKLQEHVQIKFVMSKINYKSINETIDLMEHFKVKFINLTFPHGIGNAGKYFEKVVPTYSEISSYVHEALEYCCEKSIIIETEAIPYCFLEGFEECASEHFISATYIEIKGMGTNVTDWSKKRIEMKRKSNQCIDKCLYSKICEGPWEEYADYYGFNEFKPIEINARNMMKCLVKYKKIKDFQSGKIIKDNREFCQENDK